MTRSLVEPSVAEIQWSQICTCGQAPAPHRHGSSPDGVHLSIPRPRTWKTHKAQ